MPFAAGHSYRIVNVGTGTLLDSNGGSIVASHRNGSDSQAWKVSKDCDQYVFASASSGLYLAPDGPAKNNGRVVAQRTYFSWPMTRNLSDGDVLQFRHSIQGSDYVLTASENGDSVMIYAEGGSQEQWWRFERI